MAHVAVRVPLQVSLVVVLSAPPFSSRSNLRHDWIFPVSLRVEDSVVGLQTLRLSEVKDGRPVLGTNVILSLAVECRRVVHPEEPVF